MMKHLIYFPINLSEKLQNAEIFEVWFLTQGSHKEVFTFESSYTDFKADQINRNVGEIEKEQLISAFFNDVKKGGEVSRCWIPHHGIKAVCDGQLIEIAICFMCGQCRGQMLDETFFITFPSEEESESKAIFDKIIAAIEYES